MPHEPVVAGASAASDPPDASGVDVELVDPPQPTAAEASTTTTRSWFPRVMMEG